MELTVGKSEDYVDAYTLPESEPNRIYLSQNVIHGPSSTMHSVDGKIDFSFDLMETLIHEDLHLELGKSDPKGTYVDSVAALPNGTYWDGLRDAMIKAQSAYESEEN